MPRKGSVAKRDVLPDPIYNSKLVTRLINKIMIDGKKGTAQTILYTDQQWMSSQQRLTISCLKSN